MAKKAKKTKKAVDSARSAGAVPDMVRAKIIRGEDGEGEEVLVEVLGGVVLRCSSCPEPHGIIVLGRLPDGTMILQMRHQTNGICTSEILPGDAKMVSDLLLKCTTTH